MTASKTIKQSSVVEGWAVEAETHKSTVSSNKFRLVWPTSVVMLSLGTLPVPTTQQTTLPEESSPLYLAFFQPFPFLQNCNLSSSTMNLGTPLHTLVIPQSVSSHIETKTGAKKPKGTSLLLGKRKNPSPLSEGSILNKAGGHRFDVPIPPMHIKETAMCPYKQGMTPTTIPIETQSTCQRPCSTLEALCGQPSLKFLN